MKTENQLVNEYEKITKKPANTWTSIDCVGFMRYRMMEEKYPDYELPTEATVGEVFGG